METWALITGATSGIGHEIARLLADKGYNTFLVARNPARLKVVAEELKDRARVETRIAAVDLAEEGAARAIFTAACDIPIAVLVNNAGFGGTGSFLESSPEHTRDMMHTNMDAVVELSRMFAGPMVGRGEGRILNIASVAAFQPGPYMAIYYATKAFVFSFSHALAEELAGTGVTVTTCSPGMTRTDFQLRAGMDRSKPWMRMMSAEAVARAACRDLFRGKRNCVPGFMNKVTSAFARALPAALTSRVARRINEG
jgi:short-subunit dehydrogenase